MRSLEWLIVALVSASVLGWLWPGARRPTWLPVLPALALLGVLPHLLLEGYRWQMLPAYGWSALLLGLTLRQRRRPVRPSTWPRRVLRGVGGLALLAVFIPSVALPALLPVLELPAPTGPHAVGMRTLYLKDTKRGTPFSAEPAAPRELMVQVWYPAQPPMAGAQPEPYWTRESRSAELLGRFLRMPEFTFTHVYLARTHGYENAHLAGGSERFPVIVFNHGYGGFVSQNTVQFEELASHGYVIFSLSHPGESLTLRREDGRVVPYDSKRIDAFLEEAGAAVDTWQRLQAALDKPAERDALLEKFLAASPIADESVRLWTTDTLFVMDELERLEREDPIFRSRLDLAHLGMMGMSFGGGVAGQVCRTDPRCTAVANLDGLMNGDSLKQRLEKPLLLDYSETAEGVNDFAMERTSASVYRMVVRGSLHFNHTDFSIMSPLFQQVGFLGPIDGRRMTHVLSEYTRAFFDLHLKGQDSPLMRGPSPDYPEVVFSARLNPAAPPAPSPAASSR